LVRNISIRLGISHIIVSSPIESRANLKIYKKRFFKFESIKSLRKVKVRRNIPKNMPPATILKKLTIKAFSEVSDNLSFPKHDPLRFSQSQKFCIVNRKFEYGILPYGYNASILDEVDIRSIKREISGGGRSS